MNANGLEMGRGREARAEALRRGGYCDGTPLSISLRVGVWGNSLFGIRLRNRERFYFCDECRELVGRDIPNNRIIHTIISMDHTVA